MELFITMVIMAITVIATMAAISLILASIICGIIHASVRDDDDKIMEELYHD